MALLLKVSPKIVLTLLPDLNTSSPAVSSSIGSSPNRSLPIGPSSSGPLSFGSSSGLATPPGSPIRSDSNTPPTPGKWLEESLTKSKPTEKTSRRQRKNRCHRRNRRQALLDSQLRGTIDHRHEHHLNRRAGQLETRTKRLFREGLRKAKVAAKITTISEEPLRLKYQSAEESFQHRNNISVRKESRELLEKARISAAFAIRYRSAAKLHGSGQTSSTVTNPSKHTTILFMHQK